jgi:uncharacterized BrkB/YihY/UPF0761 family membrane protein
MAPIVILFLWFYLLQQVVIFIFSGAITAVAILQNYE